MELGIYHTTKEGLPVVYQRIKVKDAKGVSNMVSVDDMRLALINNFERRIHIVFPLASIQAKKQISKAIVVLDLGSVNILKAFNSEMKEISRVSSTFSQAHYPETLDKFIIINASFFFKGVFAIVSLWLDEKVKQKIVVDTSNGFKLLSSLIDVEKIPVSYGGKCTDVVTDCPGPWQKELMDSIKKRRYFMADRQLEKQYFYTDKEFERSMNRKPGDILYEVLEKPAEPKK